MAGLIVEEDLATVRERTRIEDVVSSYVTLRSAGGGALTGLCPFHDEKTPSFRVTPSRGYFFCFGCQTGGDVIGFVQKINNTSFVEAVEFLADRIGLQLRYTEGGGSRVEPGLRTRVLEANRLAAEFFADRLSSPEAVIGRQFLAERGFDREAAERFGVGFAPTGGRELLHHLRAQKFTDAELVKAGLARESGWDYFQGRLLWPIRDAGRSVLGFGARRLHDDDRMPAKYINTPETPVYKKSSVLYGLDLARQPIAKKNQAVIVEGYTDVMAAHLSGVDTAVASCGTAFGDDHARLLQRLIGSSDALKGEVIFTFDGDAAGQAAALKVFHGDQNFISQTYVAIEPNGLDPCDLRIQHGDAAVRELVGRRVPLYRYVMANTIGQFDLDRVDGRLAALRAAAPLVGSVRDASLVSGYVHELAKMIGTDVDQVRREVSSVGRRKVQARGHERGRDLDGPPEPPDDEDQPSLSLPIPNPRDRGLEVERGTLRLMVRSPEVFEAGWNGVLEDDFTHPTYRAVYAALTKAGVVGNDWPQPVVAALDDPGAVQVVAALATEGLFRPASPSYAAEYVARLRLLTVTRAINQLKSRLQRTNPVDEQPAYNRMFAQLLELERNRHELVRTAAGPSDEFHTCESSTADCCVPVLSGPGRGLTPRQAAGDEALGMDVSHPLLSADDECRLARRIEAGILAAELIGRQDFSHAPLAELSELQNDGVRAWQEFLLGNLRLVHHIANLEASRTRLASDDLFQEGFVGLTQAVARWDWTRGLRFSTFAIFWVRKAVWEAAASQFGAAGLSPRTALRIRSMRGLEVQLTQDLQRHVSASDLSEFVGRSPEWVERMLEASTPIALQPERLLNSEGADDDEGPELAGSVAALLDELPRFERLVVRLRFGFDTAEPLGQLETAKRIGVSESTVRRIERRALRRIRCRAELLAA